MVCIRQIIAKKTPDLFKFLALFSLPTTIMLTIDNEVGKNGGDVEKHTCILRG